MEKNRVLHVMQEGRVHVIQRKIQKYFRILIFASVLMVVFIRIITTLENTYILDSILSLSHNSRNKDEISYSSVKQYDIVSPVRTIGKSIKEYTEQKLFFMIREFVKIANCRSMFDGDITEIRKAEEISEKFIKREITPLQYINMTKNCETFITERGYITDPLTEDERNFPISFSLLMYKDVEQTERLLRAIYRPQNIYCIHVDSNARDGIYQAVSGIANCFENVFTSRRIVVTWGTFTVLEPELICMQELWNKSKIWKYFINLTGQEFPLRSNYEIVQILKAYNGSNDAMAFITRDSEFTNRIIGAGKPPHGIIPMKGALHIAVSREYVDYVLHNQIARDFLNWTSHTKHASEVYFSSLQGNHFLNVQGSSKGDRSIPHAVRYKNWSRICRGKSVRGICILGTGDLPVLASRFELFANKFHLNYQPLALDCVEELHFNRTRDQYLGKLKFDTMRYVHGGFLNKN